MPKKVNLKHKTSAFFKEQMQDFKNSMQNALSLYKTGVNSLCLSSPYSYTPQGSSAPLPHNLFDEAALNEAARGDSYAIFPELNDILKKGGSITLFDIKNGLAKRGANNFLQDRILNLILQCRVGVHFGIFQPVQSLAAENGIVISPDTSKFKLEAEVLDENQVLLKIEAPIQALNSEGTEIETLGRLNCELRITNSSIYLNEMKYTKTSDTPNAQMVYKQLLADSSVLKQIWSGIQKLFGIQENKSEFELTSPSPRM